MYAFNWHEKKVTFFEKKHFEKKDVVISKKKAVQIHRCKTTSICPTKEINSK